MAEAINGLYKTEFIKLRSRWRTVEPVDYAQCRVGRLDEPPMALYVLRRRPPEELEAAY